QLLSRFGPEAKLLAGGQSLVPAMNFRLARPGVLIDITRIRDLSYVRECGDGLTIGALTPHARFETPIDDTPLGRLLAVVVDHIGHYPIRRRGTFGGSICHADPASEWCLVAVALGASMKIGSSRGERSIA